MIVSGTAEGLDPSQTYVTLVYNTGSVSRGKAACVPTNSILSQEQMFIDFWKVAVDGTGRLFDVQMGPAFASLDDIGTVSVRIVEGGNFRLQACGDVVEALPQASQPRPAPRIRGSAIPGTGSTGLRSAFGN